MTQRRAFLRDSELDRGTYAELRDHLAGHEESASGHEPRSYPGYPRTRLPRLRPRRLVGLEATLVRRRCLRELGRALPRPGTLGRVLQFAHAVAGPQGRGPVPSAGGLQAVELYLAVLEGGWLERGLYHYDRGGHHLSRTGPGAGRPRWKELVPSMDLVEGGALLWIVAGDAARVGAKYGDRGGRFLLLEAGHLMQNLCLMSASLGLCTVPLGAALEPDLARELRLPAGDAVLYAGLCGESPD